MTRRICIDNNETHGSYNQHCSNSRWPRKSPSYSVGRKRLKALPSHIWRTSHDVFFFSVVSKVFAGTDTVRRSLPVFLLPLLYPPIPISSSPMVHWSHRTQCPASECM